MDWISWLLPASIGGLCTLAGGILAFQEQNKAQIRQASSVLYYDLKSIEKYLRTEKSPVNIRYFSEWQSIAAECTFFEPCDVEQLYRIYDLVYDYDYHYSHSIHDIISVRYCRLPRFECIINQNSLHVISLPHILYRFLLIIF